MSSTDTSLVLNRLNTGPFYSKSLAKLDRVGLEQIARTLFLAHNFDDAAQDRWLGQQAARIKVLDQSVRRPPGMIGAMKANLTRRDVFHAHANLCADHMDLKSKLVRGLTLLVAEECTLRADVFRYYRKKGKLDDTSTNRWLTAIDKVLVLWCGETKARKMLKYHPNYAIPRLATISNCEACKLAVLGGSPDLLSALRAGVIARMQYFEDGGPGYAIQPQVLDVINAWLSTSYPPALRRPLLHDSDSLAPAITAFRHRKRLKRERTRAMRESRRNQRHATRANRVNRRPSAPEPSFDAADAEVVRWADKGHRHVDEVPPQHQEAVPDRRDVVYDRLVQQLAEEEGDVDEEEAFDNGQVSMLPAQEGDEEPWMADYREFIQGTGGPPMPGAFGPLPDSPTLNANAVREAQSEGRTATPWPYEEYLTRQGPRSSRGRHPPMSYREPSHREPSRHSSQSRSERPPVPPKDHVSRQPSLQQGSSQKGPPVPPKDPQYSESCYSRQSPYRSTRSQAIQGRGWGFSPTPSERLDTRDSNGVSDCSSAGGEPVEGAVRRGRIAQHNQAPSMESMQASINEIASCYEATGWGGPDKPERHVWDFDRR